MNYYKEMKALFVCTAICIAAVFTACNKDMKELDKGNTPLGLSVDNSVVVLQQKNDASNAVTLSWSTGSNYGTNAAISYTLQLDIKGKNFATAVVIASGKNNFSKTYTVKDLQDLLTNQWHIPSDSTVTLEARVMDSVWGGGQRTDVSPSQTFTVQSYKPVTTTLYLIGDATPNGWSADNATPMVATSTPGVFTWQGSLSEGSFKLITTLGSFLPSYNKGADSSKLVYRSNGNQADVPFTITTPGIYAVQVSLLDSSISFVKASLPAYSKLFVIGGATPKGWGIDTPDSLVVDPTNPFHFMYNEVLAAGEFKFPVYAGQGYSVPFYMPLSNHPDLTSTGLQLVPAGGSDFKWEITTPGAYKISLDLLNMKININPFTAYTKIWMVGDAAPALWNINNPTPLTQTAGNPYEFSYTGPMNAGEFKFPLATGDWGCDYFMAYTADEGLNSTKIQFVPKGSLDLKWKIAVAGNYKITINQLYETISIVKL